MYFVGMMSGFGLIRAIDKAQPDADSV